MAPLKVYVASATANPETKYRVQRTLMILDGLGIPFDSIDITKPEHAEQRRFMRENASKKGPNGAVLPPQFFYEDEYLGDYEDFDTSVEADTITEFLRLLPDAIESNVTTNGAEAGGDDTGTTTAKSDEKKAEEDDEEDEEWDEDEGEDEEEGEEGSKEEKKKEEEVDASETITLAKPEAKKDEEEVVEDEELEGEDEEWDEDEEEGEEEEKA
ncbi:Glutaredoxin domain-containing protein [Caenorhabditis elegans]|uniref:Glutaredoxin domain-containing protein n=1 Tax=Caenorhabditis elegans TaxID=6239 RepID=K8ES47_CAEEL|nr:Glutaredoxin domain-containing protein [Caenorhabditis elegans]CCO25587.1 Glutaredoxin domain-containing protein [Caenorhabditis elegans]|eukprot:NP_001263593.1 Uncharacterized protein CELE_Y105E8A.1 [Caenorhabditis elegans]